MGVKDRMRVAWITGASSGIGRELAILLARQGWRVVASARSAEALDELAAGEPAIVPLAVDVADATAVEAAHQRIVNAHGDVDLLVAAAGVWHMMDPVDYDAAKFRQAMEVNHLGVVHAVLAVVGPMRARRSGHIAIVSSVSGYRGLPRAAAYGPTKAALINLAETLRGDLAGDGIKVQVVNPGFVATPMTAANTFPMPFIISASEAAAAILRGLSSRRFEIAFPWKLVLLMKLLALLPPGLFFALTRRLAGNRQG
ncbi:MAG: SDR family NAD(P)-dependent oxidoreductase [Rhizobiales bacterium]|nr:SDR family NAD(P)-dependent oxidoreductase [Hyphomicrobiales bacterium]